MKAKLIIISVLCLFTSPIAQAQNPDPIFKKHYIGSTLFMLGNLSKDPPDFYQMNYGFRFTPKDELSIEAITWSYKGPLGRPYGPDFDNESSNFPGKVRAYGAGLAYKRFIWKGVFGQVHSTALKQNYLDVNGDKIQSGFQLFCTLRAGYHFRLFKNRLFIAPSIAMTFWPVNTNLPASFQAEEDKWHSYFLGEPGLLFGINF